MRYRGFKIAFDFGFVAVEAVAADLPLDEVMYLALRVDPCDCGRLTFEGEGLDRAHLAWVAARAFPAAQGLLLAALDYARRTRGRAGLDALVRELCAQDPAPFESFPVGALLERVETASRTVGYGGAPGRIYDAVTWPRRARTWLPDLSPFAR
ncbi:hypothetical protein ABZO31_03430 [Streptomyces sp. HUAS MG47]|uniref:hypothetical protein n=1 Tax=Streptomyces solicamelliae TaxID=3231716 RepID=UPI0038782510